MLNKNQLSYHFEKYHQYFAEESKVQNAKSTQISFNYLGEYTYLDVKIHLSRGLVTIIDVKFGGEPTWN